MACPQDVIPRRGIESMPPLVFSVALVRPGLLSCPRSDVHSRRWRLVTSGDLLGRRTKIALPLQEPLHDSSY